MRFLLLMGQPGGGSSGGLMTLIFLILAGLAIFLFIAKRIRKWRNNTQEWLFPQEEDSASQKKGISDIDASLPFGIPKGILHSPDEKVIAALGTSYLGSILNRGGISRSTLILSNKRLYHFGKTYSKISEAGGGAPISAEGEIDINNISSARFIHVSNFLKIFFSFLTIIPGLGLLIAGDKMRRGGEPLILIGILLSIIWLIVFIKALRSRQKWLAVDYHGCTIAIPVKWYSESEMRDFRKAIFDIKDKLQK